MTGPTPPDEPAAVALLATAWRDYSRPVLATLIRLLRDFDRAEEALHDAFLAAARRWPEDGLPRNPVAWLVSAGRFTAIDHIRRRVRFDAAQNDIADALYPHRPEAAEAIDVLPDDRLRLMLLCCHPMLPAETQVALTLREVCGLATEEIAAAFLQRTPAVAQRIVRGKARLRQAGLPYDLPTAADLPDRLGPVLQVIYLLFNEGYSAHAGTRLIRAELCTEAIRLGRLLASLVSDAELDGLLGLMLLHESRRPAREDAEGDILLLDRQDRTLWDRALVAEGEALVRRAFRSGSVGPYAIQGAIAAVHAAARDGADPDWAEIIGLYDLLLVAAPSAVVRLNRAVAVFKQAGVEAGLAALEAAFATGELADYGPAHAAAAEIYRAAGRGDDAREAYRRALAATRQEPERRRLEHRLADLVP